MTDPTRLRQILINLIGNAIKFTSRGSVRVRVLTLGGAGGSSRPAELRIEVMDTGIGMTREQLTRLFRPFSQADPSHARRFGGTGLGLSISCKLAECMGGRIEAESELGHGSRFVLTLPLRVCAGEEGGDLAASGSEGVAGAAESVRPLAGRRILVVEDGPDNQRLIGFHLRRSGALVETAGNGALGVRAAVRARDAGQPFDVILMDIQMPELDGYGATSRLRAEGMTTPIVALTAHAMDGERERCLAAGCDDYLTKPIDYPSLIGCCVRWIDSREHDRHAA